MTGPWATCFVGSGSKRGELHFYADYVRGRCMKTTVIVRADGTFMLDAVNRGEAVT